MTGFFINPFHPELYQFSDKTPHSVAVAKKKVPGVKVILGPKDYDEFKQAVAEIAALRAQTPEGKLEAKRLAAEKLAAEKLAAEKLEAEKLEAEKLEAEKLEAEKLEAEKLEAEKPAPPAPPKSGK